jgi:hypothetical protein
LSPIPRSLAAFCLSWLIAVTANGLAMARGQTAADGGLLVLCSGGGLVQVVLDGEGRPTGQVHVCPDLAATALAALGHPPPVLPARGPAGEADMPVAAAEAPRRTGNPAFAARAPPSFSA